VNVDDWQGSRPTRKQRDEEGSRGPNCREQRRKDGGGDCRWAAAVAVISAAPAVSPSLSKHDDEQRTATCREDLLVRRRGRLQDEAERRRGGGAR